jgi:hypothetical protein
MGSDSFIELVDGVWVNTQAVAGFIVRKLTEEEISFFLKKKKEVVKGYQVIMNMVGSSSKLEFTVTDKKELDKVIKMLQGKA